MGPTSTSSGTPIPISASQIRIVDPPSGDRAEVGGSDKVVDGDLTTGWSTQQYTRPYFGGDKAGSGIKPGMGILIDLGENAPPVGAVRVTLSQKGASIALRTGDDDPGAQLQSDKAGALNADKKINSTYTSVGAPLDSYEGTVMVFVVTSDQHIGRYLLLWITKLPPNSTGKFALTVNEISVLAAS